MILFAALAAAATPGGPTLEMSWGGPTLEVHRYAIVIGNDAGHPADPALAYAEHDAERVGDVLTALGGVHPEDVVLVRGEQADRVRDVFAGVARRVAADRTVGDGAESMLFVYYSGHGDARSLHLGPSDLPLTELKSLADSVDADVRVLVVDACRSGELTRLKGAVTAEPFAIRAEDRLDSEGLVIIASSSAGEDAQESERLEGGVFTHHFVAGLRGAADTSGDSRVTLTEAYRYGYARTIEATSQAPVVQHPTYAFDLRGRDDLVLTRVDDEERGGRLVLRDAGTWLVFDRDGALEAEATVGAGGALGLPAGSYLVRLREDTVVRETPLVLDRGGVVVLGRDQMTAVPYGATVRRGLSERRHTAAAVTVGGGVVGPVVPGAVAAPIAALGARIDLEVVSLGVRGHALSGRSDNAVVAMSERRVGVDLEVVRRLDLGPVAPGIGVRLGADQVWQRFDTAGVAPPTSGAVGRVGPWLGADLALGPRLSLGLSAGVDVALYRGLDDALATVPVPWALSEVVAYVR
ncbi:MAG: caspase family protein [Myxococcota bacterium]